MNQIPESTGIGDPFGQDGPQRGKRAIASTTVQASLGGLASAGWLAYTSYQATGEISEGAFAGLVVALGSFVFQIYGRWKAKTPIKSWF